LLNAERKFSPLYVWRVNATGLCAASYLRVQILISSLGRGRLFSAARWIDRLYNRVLVQTLLIAVGNMDCSVYFTWPKVGWYTVSQPCPPDGTLKYICTYISDCTPNLV
jgi:hypothetical protein